MRKQPEPAILILREDFRRHLERFYSYLHLAPPYNSVEKAIRFLSTSVQHKTQEERTQLLTHLPLKWALFEEAFLQSGLPQKHRGIICGLVRSNQCSDLPDEYSAFIKPFL